jgi:hypothetical protein
MTPRRRKSPRAKPDKRLGTSPREATGSKPRTARTPPAGRHTAASTARPTVVPPAQPGGAAARPVAVPAAPPPPQALGLAAVLPALPPAEPTLLERAERLRDDIIRSKLTHPDPWTYTAKARAWAERIQALVEQIAVAGQTPALHAAVATLAAEVEGDPEFQRARQLF